MKRTILSIALLLLLPSVALAANNPYELLSILNIAALTSGQTIPTQHQVVEVQGEFAAGDGGGGRMVWAAGSTATAEPCVTYAVSGLTTGRWVRQLTNNRINLLGCGVKPDSTTDNTTALQAAMDATTTYLVPEVWCPATTGKIMFTGTVNVPTGVTVRGQNATTVTVGQGGAVAGCQFLHTTSGAVPAFSTQTTLGATCPQVQGPSYYTFSIDLGSQSGDQGIKLNDPATANYTDSCSSGSLGQSVLQSGTIQGVVFICQGRGSVGIGGSKIFNYSIRDNVSQFCDYPWQFDGSDNIDYQHNTVSNATMADLKLVGHGTFGNMFYAHNNTFNSVYINAPYFIDSSYGQIIVDSNYFETQEPGGTAVINLNGQYDATIINNGIYVNTSLMPYWLQVGQTMEHLHLENNWGGGASPPANFPSGGYGYMYNAGGVPAYITGGMNESGNLGIPFLTDTTGLTASGYPQATPPSVSGALLASVNASSPNGTFGNYITGLKVKNGCFVYQALAANASESKFNVRPIVRDTVDVWVYGFADSGSTQLVAVSTDGGSTYTTQALTTTPTWYKVISNVVVADPVLGVKNNDLAHGSVNANVCGVTYVKH